MDKSQDTYAGPESIGKYEILGTLGRGSMGVVYKARDPEIGRVVAIKTLRRISTSSSVSETEAQLELFKNEARSAGNLRHPNLITIFDVSIDGDTPFIVMDLIDGKSLDLIISSSKQIDPETVFNYLNQVAAGLDYAHSSGIIHRDIKPANIIIDESDSVYILDFGIAKINESFEPSTQKKEKSVVGTPGYMSPEQILNDELDYSSDLFSLAVVAYECLAGERPFSGKDVTSLLSAIISKEPKSLTACGLFPEELDVQFQKALSKDKDSRFESAKKMIYTLGNAMGIEPELARIARANREGKSDNSWVDLNDNPESNEEHLPAVAEDDSGWFPMQSNPTRRESEKVEIDPTKGWMYDGYEEVKELKPGDMFNEPVVTEQSIGFTKKNESYKLIFKFAVMVGFLSIFVGGASFYLALSSNYEEQSTENAVFLDVLGNIVIDDFGSDSTGFIAPPTVSQAPTGKLVTEMTEAELLGVIVDKSISSQLKLKAMHEAYVRNIAELVNAIAYVYGDADIDIVKEALRLSRELRNRSISPFVVQLLNHKDASIRGEAVWTLEVLGDRAVVSFLKNKYLVEEDPHVKAGIRNAVENLQGFPMNK